MKKFILIFFMFLSFPAFLNAQSYADEHHKSIWYIGFGLGSGQGWIEGDTFSKYFDNEGDYIGIKPEKSPMITFNFGIGAILNPNLHIGFDGSAIRQTATYNSAGLKGEYTYQINNYLLAVTYYPDETGLSLKAGIGFADMQWDVTGDLFYSHFTETYTGNAYLIGAGYDFWLGDTFNLGLHVEYSKQNYNNSKAPSDSDFVNIYVSFYWL